MHEIILTMQDITKTYPGVVALSNVSFNIKKGEVHGLLGENGAGKSTLIKVLSGAIKPDSGKIILGDTVYSHFEPRKALDLGIVVIYQELNLIPYLSVFENIFLGNEIMKHKLLDDRVMIEKTRQILKDLQINIDPRQKIKDLSIAYQQMIEIAKAVSQKANIIIMDEPTAPLSKTEVDNLFTLIDNLKNQNISVIYISHRLEEVFALTERVTVLRDGKHIATLDTCSTNRKKLISLMVGREIADTYPPGGYEKDKKVLEVEGLTGKKFKDISFYLKEGEILGIAGLVGAGRTEVGRAIFGADPLVKGKIFIQGKEVKICSPKDSINLGLGLMPEDRKEQGILLKLSVKHNVTLAALKSILKRTFISYRSENNIVNQYIKELGIKTPHLEQKAMFLSGGNQQKIVLAKWMASKSKILIFDEPTRGIDVGAKQEIYELMRKLTREGISIIMISSEMPELIGISDRILVMSNGEIKGELLKKEVTQDKVLELAAGFSGLPEECSDEVK